MVTTKINVSWERTVKRIQETGFLPVSRSLNPVALLQGNMYSTIFLPFFLRHLRICELLCCTPFKWNKKTGRLVRVTSKPKLLFFRIQCALHLAYILAMIHQLIFGKVPIAMKLQGLVFFTIYLILLTARWNWRLDIAPMQLMNSMLDFEDKIPKDMKAHRSTEDFYLYWYMHCLQITIALFPVMNLIVLLNNTCSLPFLGSLSPYCVKGVWTNPGPDIYLILLIVETWMGYQIFYSGTKWILFTFFVGTVCILDYLHYVKRMINRVAKSSPRKRRKAAGQPGVIDSESPSDSSIPKENSTIRVSKSDVEREQFTCIGLYRCVHVVEKMFNDFLKDQIVPGMVSCLPGIQIFSLYVCIKLHANIPMPGFLTFPMVVVDAMCCNIIMFTLASRVNTMSCRMLMNWRKGLSQFSRKTAIRKQLLGCTMLKIKFGSNFIDNGTPLVIQDFCTNQTVSLLMVKSNS